MTGIDRVEYAYLINLLTQDSPLFGLIRSGAGWLLLDATGCTGLGALVKSASLLPPADLLSRLMHRGDPARAQAETAARKLAFASAARPGLARLLRRLPKGSSYLNVGHANLTNRSLATLRQAGLTITVMIHDTIPLDHPEFARPDTVAPFAARLAAVSAYANHIIHLTDAARRLTEGHLARLGRIPPGITASNGIDLPALCPTPLDLTSPYFVTLGTIEPRKNHALLLDVWDRLPSPQPRLFIIGNRGWADTALLARLDALPADGPVQVMHGLSDGAVATILSGANALLSPSLAEGFGLPPVEAAARGTAVIATDLPVTREILGNMAVYLNPADIYSWVETIAMQARQPRTTPANDPPWKAPTWDAHFKKVLSLA